MTEGYNRYDVRTFNARRRQIARKVARWVIILAVASLVALVCLAGYLIEESKAIKAAETMGFTKIELIDSHRFLSPLLSACGKSDVAAFDLQADNPRGDRVDIVVCCGWPFKGCMVRAK